MIQSGAQFKRQRLEESFENKRNNVDFNSEDDEIDFETIRKSDESLWTPAGGDKSSQPSNPSNPGGDFSMEEEWNMQVTHMLSFFFLLLLLSLSLSLAVSDS